ncbi:hypothetical protein [Bradyrhizobium monzae]|uniref:hypothetical protein n=1 Tax=Bradyrhizobium sp. Oc8 TaxID=2876780 RepID=UPI001F45C9DA|nr:hypothetical protein [Bradyrhizobium sp. Oc8]
MSTVTTRKVADITGYAKQPIGNKLLIEQALKVYSEKTAKSRAWHVRFSRMRVNEPGGGPRFIRCSYAGQCDLSNVLAAVFRTLHCADALTRASAKNALLTIGFGFHRSLSATFARKLVRTWFGIDPLNWRSVAPLVNNIDILRVAALWQPVDDLARYLPVHVTAILQPSNTGWLFAEANGTVARAVALGMISSGRLAQIARPLL